MIARGGSESGYNFMTGNKVLVGNLKVELENPAFFPNPYDIKTLLTPKVMVTYEAFTEPK